MARANGSISGAGWPAGRSKVGTAIFMVFLGSPNTVGSAIQRPDFVFLLYIEPGWPFWEIDLAAVQQNRPWPTELRLAKDRKALTVTFDSGERFALDAEYL